MAAPKTKFAMYSQYFAARFAAAGITASNVNTNLRIASTLGDIFYNLDKRHRKRAATHIKQAFPEYSDEKVDQVTRASMQHLVQLAIEVLHTPNLIHRQSWMQRIDFNGLGPVMKLLNASQSCILVTGHLGNWEVLGYLMGLLGYPIDALARPLDNPMLSKWLFGIRQKHGMNIISKFNASDRMQEVINEGGSLAFLADQNAGDKGIFVPFFGALASTYKSVGILAIRKNLPIICTYTTRVGQGFNYQVGVEDIIMPQDWSQARDPLYYVSARYMRAIENMIRRDPTQYLWMHRRWKSRPRHERLGKPMPKNLEDKLSALPWITPKELEKLKQPLDLQ